MKTLLLKLIAFLLALNALKAQTLVSSYTFTQSIQTYGQPNTGTLIGTRQQDNDVNAATLPFNFTYRGNTYASINVCSNGYLSFNNLAGFEYSAISDPSTSEVIAPFAQDLFMGTVIKGDLTSGSNSVTNVSSLINLSVGDTLSDIFFDFGGNNPVITSIVGNTIVFNINSNNTVSSQDLFFMNGSIRQNTSGMAPNRVCEFEYKNMTRFLTYDESINFKVRLYETTNRIEFVYGNIVPGSPGNPSEVGLKGANNADFNSRQVGPSNTWSTSVPSTFVTDVCDYSAFNFPNFGLSYMWSPSVCVTPTLNVASSNQGICAGQTVTLTASGAVTYSWSNGNSGNQIVITPSVSTSFTLYGFDGSCNSSVSIIQNVTPQPTITIVSTRTMICRGNTNTLTANGAGTFSWSNGSTGASIVVSPTISTTYTVTGANSSCTSQKTIAQSVSSCVGIDENKNPIENMGAFPSPFTGLLNVRNPFQEEVKLEVYDLLGTVVYNSRISGEELVTIDTETLKSGIYIVVIENGEKKLSKKVIKN